MENSGLSEKKRGSVTADASISLPVFILCFALLFSLIYEAAEEDALYRKLSEEANTAGFVMGALDVDVPFMIAAGQTKTRKIGRELFYRPFCGESEGAKQRDVTVYIFPKSGVRYHVAGCSTMDYNPNYIAVMRTEAISRGYTECRLCGQGGYDYFKKRKTGIDIGGEQ